MIEVTDETTDFSSIRCTKIFNFLRLIFGRAQMITQTHIRKKSVVLMLTILLIGLAVSLPAQADQKGTKAKWVWTKEIPKPMWWTWGDEYSKDKPVPGGILKVASTRYVGMMNPHHWPINDFNVIMQIYEGRMNFDGQYRQLNPWLVESWEVLTPTTMLVKYREGVRYHDGSPLNAESIKYLLDWINDPKNGTWSRGLMKKFKTWQVADEHTLRWETYEPWGTFPVGWMGILVSAEALKNDVLLKDYQSLSRKARTLEKKAVKAESKADKASGAKKSKLAKKAKKARKSAEKMKQKVAELAEKTRDLKNTDVHPVGSGPFRFEDASPGNYVKLKRYDDWWFGQSNGKPEMPYFDGVTYTVIPDPAIQLANLRAGKIDQMTVNKSQYRMLKNDRRLNVYTHPQNTTFGLFLNNTKGPGKDIKVRKAIAHAIDRKALIHGTQFGLARPAAGLFPGDHWAHNPKLKPVPYDPELSKKLLAEAGYADGLTLTGYMQSDPNSQTISVAIKSMLTKVGIDWKVDALSPVAAVDRFKNLEFDLARGVNPLIQDPDQAVYRFYHPDGGFFFNRVDATKTGPLIDKGRFIVDERERKKIYNALEEELYNNYTDIWLWWEIEVVARRKVIQGHNHDMFLKGRNCYVNSHPLWFKDGKRK